MEISNNSKTVYIVREISETVLEGEPIHSYMEPNLEAAKSKLIKLVSSKGTNYTINETGTKVSIDVNGKTTTYYIEQFADKKFEEVP